MDNRKIVFECRKCLHQLIVLVPHDITVDKLMDKFVKISKLDCPNCGEQPYENWYLESVHNEKKDRWEYARTEETIIGMDNGTGELKTYKVYSCPKCGAEVSDWVLANEEINYCKRCGNRNYQPEEEPEQGE